MDIPEMQKGNEIVRELIRWLQLPVEPYLESDSEIVSGTDAMYTLCSEWVSQYCGFNADDMDRTTVSISRSTHSWGFLDGSELELIHNTNFVDNSIQLIVKARDADGYNYGKVFDNQSRAVRPEWFEKDSENRNGGGLPV